MKYISGKRDWDSVERFIIMLKSLYEIIVFSTIICLFAFPIVSILNHYGFEINEKVADMIIACCALVVSSAILFFAGKKKK